MKEPNLIMKCIRLMSYLYSRRVPFFPKVIQWFIRVICSADIPVNVKIGRLSVLKHNGLGVVLHERVIIGERVTVMQNVTIGGRNGRGAPRIGNNVFIGAGACVMGDIDIGDNVMIGANAVVINSVERNTVVGGVPARYLKDINE